ncbi:Phosphoenolpyruvate-protein phosphotransferase [Clostridiales bacterium CHKCI001]|nr:Phosphoenolpyruvate-protein phosphotransferase [Clostridiales bacterium CHKCI001]
MTTLSVKKTSSKGIVIGKPFIVENPDLSADRTPSKDAAAEIALFEDALEKTQDELSELAAASDIFEGHLMIAMDSSLSDAVIAKINEGSNAQVALEDTVSEFAMIFEMMEDEYMKERSADVKDVGNRVMRKLKGIAGSSLSDIKEKVILVAKDLAPSDTAIIDLNYVMGFITELGGVTSHVSIIARNLELPALVGVNGIMNAVKKDDTIIMDAGKGTIIINPDSQTIAKYEKLAEEFRKHQAMLKELNHLPPVTIDGHHVSLCANVGNIDEIKQALKNNIDGIGLFRSEFLYMENSHFPTEEEQFKVYKEAAELLEGKEVTIRTLDIGGDKSLPYYTFDPEENPFLGWRAIRISLDLKDVFKAQLKALLRASAYGYIRIMFPMIISVEELEAAKAVLEECKQDLKLAGIPYDENIQIGIMIETPASVACVEQFAQMVDFFSIGTNDLTQYMLCVDRGNKKLASMYNSFHPAVLNSIQTVINAAHKYNVKCGMCGEFASDARAAKLLLGMGLDEFSMSAGEVPNVKYLIRNSNYLAEKEHTAEVLKNTKIADIMAALGEEE